MCECNHGLARMNMKAVTLAPLMHKTIHGPEVEHQLSEFNSGEESRSCESIGDDALDVDVLVLGRTPQLQ